MTKQFSPLTEIYICIFYFHFILKENSSSWILQAKPQVHPLKGQGICDIWSIRSCWEASGSSVWELKRTAGRHQLLFQGKPSHNCPWIATVYQNNHNGVLLCNTSSEHLIFFLILSLQKSWKIKQEFPVIFYHARKIKAQGNGRTYPRSQIISS